MLGPIPNSLGGGAYNGSFLPHGLVTFAGRAIPAASQQICIGALFVSRVVLDAIASTKALLDAGFINQIPLDGDVVTLAPMDAEVRTTQALNGLIEECS